MANKWKYADLPAAERLDMIKNGNKDVYDNEVARSLDKINQYEKAGLNTDAQKEWLNTLSYNYNLSSASQMGIAPENVKKTGYTGLYFGLGDSNKKKKDEPVRVKTSNKANFDYEVEKLTEEYKKLIEDINSEVKIAEEWLLNNGIDKESEDGKKHIKMFEATLDSRKNKHYNNYVSKLNALVKKYY